MQVHGGTWWATTVVVTIALATTLNVKEGCALEEADARSTSDEHFCSANSECSRSPSALRGSRGLTAVPCGQVWADSNTGSGWCGLGAADPPTVLSGTSFLLDPTASEDELWETIAYGLLPPDVSAAGVPVQESKVSTRFGQHELGQVQVQEQEQEQEQTDEHHFVFHASRQGAVDLAFDLSDIPPRRTTTLLTIANLVTKLRAEEADGRIEEERVRSALETDGSEEGRTRSALGQDSRSKKGRARSALYYSAQVIEFRDGKLARAVDAPVVSSIAHQLADAARNISGRVQANIWLASANACTPLHLDERANLLAVMTGRKRVVLYPPAAATAAGLFPWASSVARSARAGTDGTLLRKGGGGEDGSGNALPSLGGHPAAEVVLERGDALFIPPFWLHHVCNVVPSLSVSVWRDSGTQHERASILNSLFDSSRLPFSPTWTVCDRVAASVALCKLLAGESFSRLATHVEARYVMARVLQQQHQQRHDASKSHALPLAATTEWDGCPVETTQLITTLNRLWPTSKSASASADDQGAPASSSSPADDGGALALQMVRWVDNAKRALGTLAIGDDFVQTIVLANAFESMLLFSFDASGGARGRDASVASSKAHAVARVAASLGSWFTS
jgi:hypothetical protein